MQSSIVSKAVRLAMITGASAAALTAPAVWAEEEDVERIEVTGSRIKRADIEGASPVSVITAEQLQATGIVKVSDALQQLSAAQGGITTAVNNGGEGKLSIDLRGLGAKRTLVLVNGRRFVNSGTGANDSVDLNNIPVSMVKRIEVLKDGASAVYGSDAIAGVINVITKNDFEGFEFSAQYGETTEGDGDEYELSATFGSNFEKGNVVVNVGYYNRGEVRQGDRSFSACPLSENADGTYCAGSANSIGMGAFVNGSEGLAIGSDGNFFGYIGDTKVSDPNSDDPDATTYEIFDQAGTAIGHLSDEGVSSYEPWLQFEPGGDGSSSDKGYHPFSDADRYNYAAVSYLSTPAERANFSVNGTYEFNDDLRFISENSFVWRHSNQQMAPQPINYTLNNWTLPANYPYAQNYSFLPDGITAGTINPVTGEAVTGQDQLWPLRRMTEVGPRIFEQTVYTWRTVVGFEGTLADEWQWGVSYMAGRNDAKDVSDNYINMDRVVKSVTENCEGVSPDGTGNNPDAPCINYFGEGSLTPNDVKYIAYTDQGTGFNQQEIIEAHISGDAFDMPAGAVGIAAGIEHRRESAGFQPDALTVAGLGSGNAQDPTSGRYDVSEAFVELAIPVVADAGFIENFDIEAAVRYSDYSTFGSDTNYKIGATLRTGGGLMLRSVASTAFRAPTVNELFGGQSDSYENYADPCSNADANATVKANCIADGVTPGTPQQNQQTRAKVGGNPDLQAETADTFTVGLVYEPTFIENLSMTVDYYDIEIEDAISNVDVNTKVDVCYNSANGGVDGTGTFCNDIGRDAVGQIDGVIATLENVANIQTSGLDFNVAYNFDAAGLDWRVDYESTYLLEYDFTPYAGADPFDYVGQVFSSGGSYVEWKHSFNAAVRGDTWAFNYQMRYLEGLDRFEADPAKPKLGDSTDAVMYHDISGSYFVNDYVTVTAGIDNLFDEEPPYVTNGIDGNTDTYTYDVLGSRWYVQTIVKF
ncbi:MULTISPECIES: TonB-dependent siderophore receptor [Ferrimonas]|uniref:TonB-dependent receptor plug domain-containing protein n=1 Tax=Ferrimonas TaxID=44011 RepID=UPI0004125B83|nr:MULTISPECIES: TonB-dependent receptor [Ferrimonas]USD36433.1 TonB-dependent receptor [Ferrimonas sp. SCSIO 43195]